ncbi:MAG: hypothetical protein R3295_02080 [Marinobacter sp.]|nr:hypothetical protein [Marinobacter sp.]
MNHTSYKAFASDQAVTTLNHHSAVDDVERAAMMADALPHWFDRHRAVANISERIGVEADLIFKLMRKGASQ